MLRIFKQIYLSNFMHISLIPVENFHNEVYDEDNSSTLRKCQNMVFHETGFRLSLFFYKNRVLLEIKKKQEMFVQKFCLSKLLFILSFRDKIYHIIKLGMTFLEVKKLTI